MCDILKAILASDQVLVGPVDLTHLGSKVGSCKARVNILQAGWAISMSGA